MFSAIRIEEHAMSKHGSVREEVSLTKREIEVLTLLIEGRSSMEVADMLYVSKRTVDFHSANIYDKLQVTNRVKAYQKAARLGIEPFKTMRQSEVG